MESVEEDIINNLYIFKCPHCKHEIEVERNYVNCAIFRHGSFFITLPNGAIIPTEQINPHTPKHISDQLVAQGKIVGCGKPFKFIYGQNGKHHVEVCDYL